MRMFPLRKTLSAVAQACAAATLPNAATALPPFLLFRPLFPPSQPLSPLFFLGGAQAVPGGEALRTKVGDAR